MMEAAAAGVQAQAPARAPTGAVPGLAAARAVAAGVALAVAAAVATAAAAEVVGAAAVAGSELPPAYERMGYRKMCCGGALAVSAWEGLGSMQAVGAHAALG